MRQGAIQLDLPNDLEMILARQGQQFLRLLNIVEGLLCDFGVGLPGLNGAGLVKLLSCLI